MLLLLQVAKRVGFSVQQLQQLRLGMQVYNRMCRTEAHAGSDVLHKLATLSISRVLDGGSSSGSSGSEKTAAQAPQQCSASAPQAVSAAAAAAAAAAFKEAEDGSAQMEAINSQLQRHMRLRNIQAMGTTCVLLDCVTKVQMAQMVVGELRLADPACCCMDGAATCRATSPAH
jgi:hypothetical protein